MARRSVLSLVIVVSWLLAAPVTGGERTPEKKRGTSPPARFSGTVTVTATGEATPADEIPAAVTVIGREEIEDAGSEDAAELLRRVPGLTVARSGGPGALTSLFTRGTESDHTLVLLDGVRLNSPYFGGYDLSQLLTAGLERIEVVRGPYSARYGADAVGGVVNLIPRAPVRGRAATLALEGGEGSWARGELTASWGGGGTGVLVSGLHREGEGELANSGFSTDQWLLHLSHGWDGGRVALLGQYLDADLEIPFTGATLTPRRRQSSRQELLAVPLELRLGPAWTVRVVASHVERDLAFRDPDDPFGFTRSDTAADTDELELESRHRLGRHAVSWGGGWRGDTVDDASTFGVNLEGREVTVTSAFVQDLWRPAEALTVLAGVRWDDADEWGSEVSPRLSLGWRVAPGWELVAGYGEAFRQPSVGELYFPFSGNPDLRPEISRSWEAGVRRWCDRLDLSWQLAAFTTDLDDLIQFDFATFTFANVARAEISGAELAVDAGVAAGVRGRLALTFLDTEDDAGQELLRRPRWSGSFTLAGRPTGALRGDLTVRWVGPRDDVDPVTFARVRSGGFVTADLAVAWRVAPGIELTARVLNLADRRYEEVRGYPAPRRRVLAGVRLGS